MIKIHQYTDPRLSGNQQWHTTHTMPSRLKPGKKPGKEKNLKKQPEEKSTLYTEES